MNNLIENIALNGLHGHGILTWYTTAVRDEKNKPIFTDENKVYAKHKGYGSTVTLFVRGRDEDGKTITQSADISIETIKKIHAEILKIEAIESEDIYDENPF